MWDKVALLERQFILAEEFDRRLADSLTLIAGVLSIQSRAAATLEAAIQLNTAAQRVAAFARVHHRLDLIDDRHAAAGADRFDGFVQHALDRLSAVPGETARNHSILGRGWLQPGPGVASRQPERPDHE